ncbi:MAG: ABC transporter permease [Actinobacteria bacterium]|nr:ABC transporter permease [Actinomycetota bacterium]
MSDVAIVEQVETEAPSAGLPSRRTLFLGAFLVLLIIVVALVSFVWTPHDPTLVSLQNRLAGPGSSFLLGTDQYGRDLVSQMMVGSRTTLFVGIIAVAIAMCIGVPVGAVAAVRRGWLDEVIMRLADVVFAFPAVLMAILLAAGFGGGTVTAMTAIGISYVPVFARVTRGASLQILEREFVLAARAYAVGPVRNFVRHVLPNISHVLIVQATIAFALAILAEAALSYLGLGTQPPTPSWGRMLREAQTYISIAPRLAIWPGLAIAVSVLGFSLLGDGLRDALDPKFAERGKEPR